MESRLGFFRVTVMTGRSTALWTASISMTLKPPTAVPSIRIAASPARYRTPHHRGDPLRRIVPVDFGQCGEDTFDVRRRLHNDSDDGNGLIGETERGVVDPEEAGLRLHVTSTGDGP